MKITINTRTVFVLPTGLGMNRLTAGIIRRKLKKEGIILTRKQMLLFIKTVRRYKKSHTDWNLAEVERKNGDTITVRI